MTEYPGPGWSFSLAVLASVTLTISGAMLLIGRVARRCSAPTREVVWRVGLCLAVAWPLLVVGGGVIGLSSERRVPTVEHGSALTSDLDEPVAMSPYAVSPSALATTPREHEPLPVTPSQSVPVFVPQEMGASTVDLPAHAEIAPSVVPPPIAEPVSPSIPRSTAGENTSEPPSIAVANTPVPARTTSLPTLPTKAKAAALTIPAWVNATWRVLCWLWGAGALLAWIALARDLLRLRRIRRQFLPVEHEAHEALDATLTLAMQATGLRRRPEVFLFQAVGSPCTSGVWRPILILPPSLLHEPPEDSATLLGVLTHECAHIVRRDVAWSLFARGVQAVYWWEPGLRRIVRELSHLREEICDNHVLSSSIDARLYAKALVDFAAGSLFRPLIGVIGMVGKNNPLSDRVERLLQETPDKATRLGWRSKWGVALVVVLVSGLLGVIGARAEISQVLSQVLEPAFEQPPVTEPIPFPDNVDTPAAMGRIDESQISRIPQPHGEPPVWSPLGVPTEAGSGVQTRPEVLVEGEYVTPRAIPPASTDVVVQDIPTPRLTIQQSAPQPVRRRVRQSYSPSDDPTPGGHQDPFSRDPQPGITPKLADVPRPVNETLSCEVPHPGDFPPGTAVVVTLTLPEGESPLPKRIRMEGLTVVVPGPELSLAPPALEVPALGAIPAVPPEPPAPESATRLETSHPIVLSGPKSSIATWAALRSKGALTVVTKAITPTAETAKASPLQESLYGYGGRSTFYMQVEALADEKGQFRGLCCWGRELPSTSPDKGISELTQLLTRWKAECLEVASVGQAVPPINAGDMKISASNGPENHLHVHFVAPGQQHGAEVIQLVVGIHVFDDMRFGDVQSIMKTCTDLKLQPHLANNAACCSECKVPLRVFAPAQLTMVYDKKGQRVGEQVVLLAEKAGTTGVQVVAESQIDATLATFAKRHASTLRTLILADDPDLPLKSLLSFYVRANRAGIMVVRRSSIEELPLTASDQLVPLVDDSPLPPDFQLGGMAPETYDTRPRDTGSGEPLLPSPGDAGFPELPGVPEPTPFRGTQNSRRPQDAFPAAEQPPGRDGSTPEPVPNDPGIREI